MGRIETKYEGTAVASARNALRVYAVLAALCGVLLWALWSAVVEQYGLSGPGADLVAKTILVMYGAIAAAHLVLAYFVGRASTIAWALALGLDVLFLVWTLLELLERPGFLRLVPISFNVWVVGKLLDSDVVRVFGRSRRSAPPPEAAIAGLPPASPGGSGLAPAWPAGPGPAGPEAPTAWLGGPGLVTAWSGGPNPTTRPAPPSNPLYPSNPLSPPPPPAGYAPPPHAAPPPPKPAGSFDYFG